MAAVPRDAAEAIWRMRCNAVHRFPGTSSGLVDDPVRHPLIDGSGVQRAVLLRALAGCAPGTPFAQFCSQAAEQIVALDLVRTGADANSGDAYRMVGLTMVGEVMRFVLQAWNAAGRIDALDAQQDAWCARNHRARRVLRAARIPLWVVSALSGVNSEDVRSMTAETLVERAGLSQAMVRGFDAEEPSPAALLADAESALRLLRILAALQVEPAAWNSLLEEVAARMEAVADTNATGVGEIPVPPRPCQPPGALILSEPRVPRAPGPVAPRRRIDRDRSRLRHCGGCGGRLAA
jgi:hypothetical protein